MLESKRTAAIIANHAKCSMQKQGLATGVIAPIHSLSHNTRPRLDICEHLQMNALFIYVRRPSEPRCTALRCASAIAQPQKKNGPGGRVRRAGGWAVTPAARRDPPAVTIPPRNPRSSRKPCVNRCAFQTNHKHTFSLNKSKKHLFIFWTYSGRMTRGGKSREGNLAVCGQKPLRALV